MKTQPEPLSFDCPYRILIGPLYNPSLLGRWQSSANIRCFNFAQDVRVTEMHAHLSLANESHIALESANFSDVLAGLPEGWEPDLVIWYNVSLMGIPPGIEDCPYPTLGVMHDWTLNLHPALDYVEAFDHVVADRAFLEVIQHQGFNRCSYWPCYAHDPMQHYLIPGLERPYDVVFLGNMGYHYHRERNPWLERLARLGDRYKILISDRYYKDDYTRLLNQSKIAFNFSVRGEMNLRSYEAAACGALVLCESDNLEIQDILSDGDSCVLYDEVNFEEKISYYLAHDQERQRIAANGVQTIAGHDYTHQFARLLELVPKVRQAFESGERQAFRQRSPVWRSLLQARQFSQGLIPGSAERGLRILAECDLPSESKVHVQAVAATLSLNRFCQPYRLLDPEPVPAEAVAALRQLEAAMQNPAMAAEPAQLWHAYNLACGWSLLQQPQRAAPLWGQLIPLISTAEIDLRVFSWLELLPRVSGREVHDFNSVWNTSAAAVLAGKASPEALRSVLLWQAWELTAYCLLRTNQPEPALKAFLQAEARGPGSYYTYAPLLQLLFQRGDEAALLACLQRAVAKLGLIETLQRDLMLTLIRQQRWAEAWPVLQFYRRLMQCFEGGSTHARESIKTWIPGLMSWMPELLETSIEWQRPPSPLPSTD